MDQSKLVVVQAYASRPEAELARGALEDSGIQAIVQADTAGGMREHLAWSGAGFKLLVREDDATLAHGVLTQLAEGNESLKTSRMRMSRGQDGGGSPRSPRHDMPERLPRPPGNGQSMRRFGFLDRGGGRGGGRSFWLFEAFALKAYLTIHQHREFHVLWNGHILA
jgi:hypothetical protein